MKRKLMMSACLCVGVLGTIMAQSVRGLLIDENKQPISFANVVLLTLQDSSFVKGVVSDESGSFRLDSIREQNYLLRVSYIGYKDSYQNCRTGNIGTIVLRPEAIALDEAVVVGKLPTYHLKGSTLVTHIQETLLSTVGTANDVLKRIPGLKGEDGSFEVFGKGEPLIYINGRLLRDKSELDRLSSKDISKVELNTNPGSEYDATVKAVLRIRTIKHAGDGWGFNTRANLVQGRKTSTTEQLGVNFRKGGFDLFGNASFNLNQRQHSQQTNTYAEVDTLWNMAAHMRMTTKNKNAYGQLGTNYEFNPNHSIGATYSGNKSYGGKAQIYSSNDIFANEQLYDHLDYDTQMLQDASSHQLNAYYAGKVADKLGIDFNADWYLNNSHSGMLVDEESEDQEDRNVTTDNRSLSRLYAAKLVMNYPLASGELRWGGEYNYIHRVNRFTNPQEILPTTGSRNREQTAAAFIDYSIAFGQWQTSVGLRYEHVDFDYYDHEVYQAEQSRLYDNLFPSLSLSAPVGKTQMSLSYTAKTRRPSFQQLRSDVQYDDRFTYEGGNPLLRPSTVHDLTYQLGYKFINFSLSYQYKKDVFSFMAKPYEPDPKISFFSFENFPHAQYLDAGLSVSPKIAFWEPNLYVGFSQQFFTMVSMGEQSRFDKPQIYLSLDNSFRLPAGWVINLHMNYNSESHNLQMLSGSSGSVGIGVRRSFFHEALLLDLRGTDLFATEREYFEMYSSDRYVVKDADYDSRQVRFTVTYRFNATRSKYKGSGAAGSQINRL